jgi:signal transduction histidine kinase
MTAPSYPVAPPRARLWPVVIVLTCCFAIYVIVMPLLFRRASGGWPLAAGAGVADTAAAGATILLFVLRRETARADDAVAYRDEQTGQRLSQYREREQQLLRDYAQLRGECTQLRGDCEQLRESLSKNTQAVRQTVTVRLPAALEGGTVPPGRTEGVSADLTGLLERAVAAAADAEDRQESMRTAIVSLSRRVQTSAHRLQEEATLMADRHPGDAGVLDVSMRVDHAAAQQARHAQSMAVLCGEWPGQQWMESLPLADVVRAAAGRIIAYQRIEVAGDPDVAIAAPVVEPLIHLVAELLANATQSSPPATQVPVTVRAVQRGAVIEIHDCGVGLDEHHLAQARDIAAGIQPVRLDELGEFPQTGLAVVGQYVRRHGFRVDLAESVYGGIRAVVGIPAESVEAVEPAGTTGAPVPAVPEARVPEPAMAAVDSGRTGRTGLPRRHSPRHASVTAGLAPAPDPAPDPALGTAPGTAPGPAPGPALGTAEPGPPSPEEAGAWMGAFLGGESDSSDHNDTFISAGAEDSPAERGEQ